MQLNKKVDATIFFRPIEMDTSKILKGHNPERSTKEMREDQVDRFNFDKHYALGDKSLNQNDHSDSDDDLFHHRPRDIRVAKEAHEIREDLLNMFKD